MSYLAYLPYFDRVGRLVIKMGIDEIGKNFVKSMSVKKFSYLGQFILGLRTPAVQACPDPSSNFQKSTPKMASGGS